MVSLVALIQPVELGHGITGFPILTIESTGPGISVGMATGKRISNTPFVSKIAFVYLSFLIGHGSPKYDHFSQCKSGVVITTSSIAREEKRSANVSHICSGSTQNIGPISVNNLQSLGHRKFKCGQEGDSCVTYPDAFSVI